MATEHIENVGLEEAKRNFESSFGAVSKAIGVEPKIQEAEFLNLVSSRGSVFSLTQIFSAASNIYPQLLNLKWKFLVSNKKLKYVVSDNPVYYFSPHSEKSFQGDRIIGKNIEVTIPLSKKVALIAMKNDIQEGYGKATRMIIKSINKRTVWGAKSNIYGSFNDETFLSFVQKNKDIRPRMVLVTSKGVNGKA